MQTEGDLSAEGQQPSVFSIGHSTRPLAELVEILQGAGVKTLVDVRTVPKSRTNPQFNRDALQEELPGRWGLGYEWMGKALGGLRKANKELAVNLGWDNESFRGYADYMQTAAFKQGIEQLLALARERGPVALMCAEVVHFQCHRRLLSDALAARGIVVRHLTKRSVPATPHKVTEFARTEGINITYPAYPHKPKEKKKGPMDAFLGRGSGSNKKRKSGGTADATTAATAMAKDSNGGSPRKSPRGGKSPGSAAAAAARGAAEGGGLRRSPRKPGGSRAAPAGSGD